MRLFAQDAFHLYAIIKIPEPYAYIPVNRGMDVVGIVEHIGVHVFHAVGNDDLPFQPFGLMHGTERFQRADSSIVFASDKNLLDSSASMMSLRSATEKAGCPDNSRR